MAEPTIYRDTDGRECSLITMCRREPEWAASRIDTLTKALAARTVICDEKEVDSRRLHQVLLLLGDHGCDCECGCDSDGHNADCEPCFACRIGKAAEHG